jgi:DNA modification methylase
MNSLILGDNLEVLKRLNSESVDLIYLDPPFFSNRNYEVIWGDAGEIRSFQDRWLGGIPHYIDWLKDRVREMHRILKPTGSIFLHCDWHADAHIRVLILEPIFGSQNFRNKITWKRSDSHNDAKKQMPNICDDIYFYSKSDKYTFHVLYGKHADKTLKEWYQYLEFPDKVIRKMTKAENDSQTIPVGARRFNTADMSNPSRVYPGGQYDYKGYSHPSNGWRFALETMQKLDAENKLFYPKEKTGRIMLKRYLDEQKGTVIGDLWTDIDQMRGAHSERIGYPTQKPEKLLERIIEMASNEGDVVLDPFVGGGTTVAVADRLKRQWIGMDQSVQAVKVTEMRLIQQRDLFSQPFDTQLLKYDLDTLRFSDAFEFEQFIITQFGGTPNVKQRGDLGIDGKASDNTPIQVKRSDGIGRNVVDNFQSAITRYDKRLYEKNKSEERPVGYLIAFSFGKGAFEEVARLKNVDNVIIKLVKVSEIVPMAERPKLQVMHTMVSTDKKGLHNVQLVATAQSDCEIQFYSWDMDYKADLRFRPSILLDKKGEQSLTLKTGSHTIAVKVVNDNGLEAIEIVRLVL